jgi:hypothetical protein
MVVLEATGNIFRRASIGKPDFGPRISRQRPDLSRRSLPFRVVCRVLAELGFLYPSLSKRRRIPVSITQAALAPG